jgi:GNAT superfamily N-acetyltransferase
MAVRPERRRRGVGRALMAAALDLARAEGRAIVIDGIELRDRVWLDRAVGA